MCHELFKSESDPRLADLAAQLEDVVEFDDRRVLYSWIGGTRIDWRGQGQFRALTEEQEAWAVASGFDEVVVKTKNRHYEMRGTLANLHFNVIKFADNPISNLESKVFLSKQLGPARAGPASQRPDATRERAALRHRAGRTPGRPIADARIDACCPTTTWCGSRA